MTDIGKEIRELDKARREYMQEVMKEYDKEHYAKKRILQEQCAHNFKFSHFGPLWHSWSYCTICGKSLVKDPE